jgi:TolA-binding protein
MRGLSLQLAKRRDDAIAAYQEGLKNFAPPEGTAVAAEAVEPAQNAYRCGKGAARLLREAGQVEESDAAYAAAFKILTSLPAEQQTELDKLVNEWALLSYENQRYERSDELFKLLIEKRPDSELADDARLYLAESQFFAGKRDEAAAAFKVLADDSKADEFVRRRASLLLLDIAADREDWDELLKDADRFLERFPESDQRAYARYRSGEAALQLDQLNRAIADLSALAAVQDEKVTKSEWYSSVYVLLGEAQFRAKDYPAVEKTVAEFRQRFPASPLLYHADEILGRSYKQRAMMTDARAALTKVTNSEAGRRTRTAAKAQFHIAETYLIEKDYAAALAEYYKVYVNYQFPEWQAPALFQAGQCDESLGNKKEATTTYETLMKEFGDTEFAKKAQERLAEIKQQGQSGDGEAK